MLFFGPFETLSIITNPKDIKLTKIKTYNTPHPFVHRIVSTRDNSVWINCYETNTLQEVQTARELTTMIREYNDKTLFDINVLKTGNLLLTQAEDSHLYSLSITGEMRIVHDFSPLLPKAVYVSDDNIIVSTREKGDVFHPSENSRRQIVVLDQTGKQKVSVIKYDKQNKRLFSFVE